MFWTKLRLVGLIFGALSTNLFTLQTRHAKATKHTVLHGQGYSEEATVLAEKEYTLSYVCANFKNIA